VPVRMELCQPTPAGLEGQRRLASFYIESTARSAAKVSSCSTSRLTPCAILPCVGDQRGLLLVHHL
jgi:hypothetical protein